MFGALITNFSLVFVNPEFDFYLNELAFELRNLEFVYNNKLQIAVLFSGISYFKQYKDFKQSDIRNIHFRS